LDRAFDLGAEDFGFFGGRVDANATPWRTIESHLAHIHRKLGVRDKLG
jgi:hypothetical protein